MPESISTLFLLFAACFVLAAATRRHWEALGASSSSLRRMVGASGWLLLFLSAGGFVARLGSEIGIAWFLLWLGLAAILTTVCLSLRPRPAAWLGPVLSSAAVVLWILKL